MKQKLGVLVKQLCDEPDTLTSDDEKKKTKCQSL